MKVSDLPRDVQVPYLRLKAAYLAGDVDALGPLLDLLVEHAGADRLPAWGRLESLRLGIIAAGEGAGEGAGEMLAHSYGLMADAMERGHRCDLPIWLE
jgi:hypothetical protein